MREKLTTEQFVSKVIVRYGNRYDYSLVKYINTKTLIPIICSVHGIFEQTSHMHLKGQGCPKCNTVGNVSEPKLYNKLKTHFLSYKVISQGKPIWLKSGKFSTQRFDIYFPDHNIAVEYQGGQHFKSIDHWGGDDGLNYRIELDERKRNLADNYNCKLFYFSYDRSYIPKGYSYKVYSDEQKLIDAINTYIQSVELRKVS